ncbi:MAG: amidohydrolase family protein, partial [Trueperaceae bacterium]
TAGVPLDPARLLWLATAGGAEALGLSDRAGDLTPGKEADLVVLRPPAHGTLAERLRHARDAHDALAAIVTLASEADVERTLVGGEVAWRAPGVEG